MRLSRIVPACALVVATAGLASAGVETRTINITNDTGTPWESIIFRVAPATLITPLVPFSAIRFVEDLGLHTASQPGATVAFTDAPTNRLLAFDFSEAQPLLDGQSYEFTLTVNNPFNVPFAIAWRSVDVFPPPVPAPGTLVLAAGSLALIARRRR